MQDCLIPTLINLIASETCGAEAVDLTREALPESFWESLYRASKSQDMAHIVGAALEKQGGSLPEEIAKKFRKQQMLAVYRYQQIQYELSELCRVLEDIPFFSCLQSFPASGCFPLSQFFASGGQRIGLSASTSVLSVNIQD